MMHDKLASVFQVTLEDCKRSDAILVLLVPYPVVAVSRRGLTRGGENRSTE